MVAVIGDAELLDAFRSGDAGALGGIYDRHARGVLAFVLGIVGDHHRAEEVLQNVFVSFARTAGSLPPGANVRSYLFSSARNAALNELRSERRKNRFARSYALLARLRADASADVAAKAETEEMRLRLNEELGQLRPEEREVLLLHCQGGLSFAEMAEVLGIPQGTAATRYRAAVGRLRERLSRG